MSLSKEKTRDFSLKQDKNKNKNNESKTNESEANDNEMIFSIDRHITSDI